MPQAGAYPGRGYWAARYLYHADLDIIQAFRRRELTESQDVTAAAMTESEVRADNDEAYAHLRIQDVMNEPLGGDAEHACVGR